MEIIYFGITLLLCFRLWARISSLEEKYEKLLLNNTQSRATAHDEHSPDLQISENVDQSAQQNTENQLLPYTQDLNEESSTPNALIEWLKKDWLTKLGGALVILGVSFLMSLTFVGIGPIGKILSGYFLACICMGFGMYITKTRARSGMSINIIGATIMVLVTYIARTPDFNLLSSYTAGLLMLGTSFYVAFCAYVYRFSSVAHVGLLLAMLVPILSQSESESVTKLFTYLLIVTLGYVWLAMKTNWRTLILLSQICIICYSVVYLNSNQASTVLGVSILAAITGAAIFGVSLYSMVTKNDRLRLVDGFIALLNMSYGAYWIFELVPKDFHGVSFAILGLINAITAYIVFIKTKEVEVYLLYGSVASILIFSASMILIDSRHIEIIVGLLEALLIVTLAHKITNDQNIIIGSCAFFFYPTFKLAILIDSIYSKPVLEDFAILLSAIFIYLWAAIVTRQYLVPSRIFAFIGLILGTIFTWLLFHTYVANEGVATFLSLLTYTLFGLSVVWYFTHKASEANVKIGRYILGLVALRVIVIDAWSFENTIVGISICIVIGLLLLSTAIINKKK